MNLITKVELPNYNFKINLQDQLMFIGSCFTENIGRKFESTFFNVLINPFGVTYNPISIADILQIIMDLTKFGINDVFVHNNLYHSFMHHSSFSCSDINQILHKINSNIEFSHNFLKNTNFLFITYGTSIVYTKDNKIVNNCHKLPSSVFLQKRLSIDEIFDMYKKLIVELKKFNPKIKIILTVSPVRHLKDGAIENQISKSTLILTSHKICDFFDDVFYFPSYEIVMDELRDYRFYAADMFHTNEMAVNYIWEIICDKIISKSSKSDLPKLQKINDALEHRLFNSNSSEINSFIVFLEKNLDYFENKYPKLNYNSVRLKINELKSFVK